MEYRSTDEPAGYEAMVGKGEPIKKARVHDSGDKVLGQDSVRNDSQPPPPKPPAKAPPKPAPKATGKKGK